VQVISMFAAPIVSAVRTHTVEAAGLMTQARVKGRG
jgi:hypothetical protein